MVFTTHLNRIKYFQIKQDIQREKKLGHDLIFQSDWIKSQYQKQGEKGLKN